MKRLLVVCAVVLTLMASPCFAIEYCKDFLESGNAGGWSASLKTFDDEWTMGVGDEISVDIWLNDVPEDLLTAGVYLTYEPSLVSVESVVAYDLSHGGPWTDSANAIEPEPDGPGTYRVALLQFACVAPDGDGDIIIAKVTFKCQALGDANISIETVPNFATVAGCSVPTVVYDPEIDPNTITIHQQQDICEGNFDGDQDVDGTDAAVFKSDFGRSPFSNPCPSTTTTTITTGGCPYSMIDCGDKCVDSMTDEDYCGVDSACLGGVVCGATERCIAGTCEEIAVSCVPPAPVSITGQKTSYAAGDDGDFEWGVAWPNPRFTDNLDGTVTDNLTGLIWLKNAQCFGHKLWNSALSDANGLSNGQCGLTDGSSAGDWRLPNRFELESLLDLENWVPALPEGHPFNEDGGVYWSSSTLADEFTNQQASTVSISNGTVDYYDKSLGWYRVWPVKGGRGCEEEDSRLCGTDVGECSYGTEICTEGKWSVCSGQGPIDEVCDDGLDNDCDGDTDIFDDDCCPTMYYPCASGEYQCCYPQACCCIRYDFSTIEECIPEGGVYHCCMTEEACIAAGGQCLI